MNEEKSEPLNDWILISLRLKAKAFLYWGVRGSVICPLAHLTELLYTRSLRSVLAGLHAVLHAASLCASAFAHAVPSAWDALFPEGVFLQGRLWFFSVAHLCSHGTYNTPQHAVRSQYILVELLSKRLNPPTARPERSKHRPHQSKPEQAEARGEGDR